MARDVEINVTASDRTGMALSSAERNFKRTGDRLKREGDKLGEGLGKGIGNGVGKAAPQIEGVLASVGSSAGPLLAAGAIAAAPLIGATLSAAIIGGAGIGGVIGGVYLAARDPRVQAAGKQLGEGLLSSLESDASVFVEPVLDGINQIEGGFEGLRPKIQSIFGNSSRYVQPLVAGIVRGVDGIARGIDTLVAHGGPVIDAISDSFGELGGSVGDALETIAGGAPEAADAVRDLTRFLSATIEVTGATVRALTELYGVVSFIPRQLSGLGAQLGLVNDATFEQGNIAKHTATATGVLSGAIDDETAAAAQATPNLQDIAAATRALYSANNDLYSSETDVASAVSRATKSIKENGRTLSLNSEKGRENRAALSTVAGALQRNYDNYVKVNGVGRNSARVADNLRGQFVRLAERAGLSATKAKELANRLLDIPSSRTTKLNLQSAQALEDAREIRRAIDSVHSKTVTVTVARRLTGSNLPNSALAAALRKNFDATSSFAFAGGGGSFRTEQPRAVVVDNQTNVRIDLDGRPFRDYTDRRVDDALDRAAFRQRVGRR